MITMEELYRMYAGVHPWDHVDARWFMNEATREELACEVGLESGVEWEKATIFNIPVEIDQHLPDGIVQIRVENDFDRAIRRASASGMVVNVMKADPLVPELPPVPEPTMKAVLAKWWKRVRR